MKNFLMFFKFITVSIVFFLNSLASASETSDIGLDTYWRYDLVANPGLEYGTELSQQDISHGMRYTPGVKDPYSDKRLLPEQATYLQIPKNYIRVLKSSVSPNIDLNLNNGDHFLWPILPTTKTVVGDIEKIFTSLKITLGTYRKTNESFVRTASRSNMVMRDGDFTGVSLKSSSHYYDMIGPGNPTTDLKPFDVSNSSWGVLLSDFIINQFNKLPKNLSALSPLVFVPDVFTAWVQLNDQQLKALDRSKVEVLKDSALSVRDLSPLKSDHIYITEFAVFNESVSVAIPHVNMEMDVFSYWLNHDVAVVARNLAWAALFTQIETFSLHSQNKHLEFDKNFSPTDRLVIKDASDFELRQMHLSNESKKEFSKEHFENYEFLIKPSINNYSKGTKLKKGGRDIDPSKAFFVSTIIQNRVSSETDGFSIFDTNVHLTLKTFYDSVIKEFSFLTGVEARKLENISNASYNFGYINVVFDTSSSTWKKIIRVSEQIKSGDQRRFLNWKKRVKAKKSLYLTSSLIKNSKSLYRLLRMTKLNRAQHRELKDGVSRNPMAAARALFLLAANMKPYNVKALSSVVKQLDKAFLGLNKSGFNKEYLAKASFYFGSENFEVLKYLLKHSAKVDPYLYQRIFKQVERLNSKGMFSKRIPMDLFIEYLKVAYGVSYSGNYMSLLSEVGFVRENWKKFKANDQIKILDSVKPFLSDEQLSKFSKDLALSGKILRRKLQKPGTLGVSQSKTQCNKLLSE